MLTALGFASSCVGYAQLNAGMPAYARAVGEVPTEGLGLAFAANTLVIVAIQLIVLRRTEGRQRTRVIAVIGSLWSVAWLSLGLSGLVPGTVGASLLVAACASVFGLGETLLQPTVPALVNDLAPPSTGDPGSHTDADGAHCPAREHPGGRAGPPASPLATPAVAGRLATELGVRGHQARGWVFVVPTEDADTTTSLPTPAWGVSLHPWGHTIVSARQ